MYVIGVIPKEGSIWTKQILFPTTEHILNAIYELAKDNIMLNIRHTVDTLHDLYQEGQQKCVYEHDGNIYFLDQVETIN